MGRYGFVMADVLFHDSVRSEKLFQVHRQVAILAATPVRVRHPCLSPAPRQILSHDYQLDPGNAHPYANVNDDRSRRFLSVSSDRTLPYPDHVQAVHLSAMLVYLSAPPQRGLVLSESAHTTNQCHAVKCQLEVFCAQVLAALHYGCNHCVHYNLADSGIHAE